MAGLSNLIHKSQTPDSTPGGGGGSSPWPWLVNALADPSNPTQGWGEDHGYGRELGVDLGMPMGTPITSLTTGVVLGSGYYSGGGVVSVKSRVNGKTTSVYYQHFDLIAGGITPGAIVTPGQTLGWSGGQLQGGHHPSSPADSSGPHLEVGFNAPIHGNPDLWHPLGPNYDPLPWLQSIASGHGPHAAPLLGQIHQQASGHIPGFIVVCQALDQVEQFEPWNPPNTPIPPSLVADIAQGNIAATAIDWSQQGIEAATGHIGDTIGYTVGWLAGNGMAFFIRSIIVIAGLICLLLVIFNVVRGINNIVIQPVAQDVGALAGGAAKAALK